jgi:hypothetical protein
MTPLAARRCVQHRDREAVARCPGCGEFFCRECVVEHGGRLLCARCLRRESSAGAGHARRHHFGRILATIIGGLGLWLFFLLAGLLLARIPTEVHEGTVWRQTFNRAP